MNRARLALVDFVDQEKPFDFAVGRHGFAEGKVAEDSAGLVGGTVVHDDNLNVIEERGAGEEFEPLETRTNQILLVIDRNENGKSDRSLHRKSQRSYPGRDKSMESATS
jgi:hypothetical protein